MFSCNDPADGETNVVELLCGDSRVFPSPLPWTEMARKDGFNFRLQNTKYGITYLAPPNLATAIYTPLVEMHRLMHGTRAIVYAVDVKS